MPFGIQGITALCIELLYQRMREASPMPFGIQGITAKS